MEITLRQLTMHLWCVVPIVVIEHDRFEQEDSLDTMRHKAVMTGDSLQLLSVSYSALNERNVDSYGIIENTLVIVIR